MVVIFVNIVKDNRVGESSRRRIGSGTDEIVTQFGLEAPLVKYHHIGGGDENTTLQVRGKVCSIGIRHRKHAHIGVAWYGFRNSGKQYSKMGMDRA